MVVFVLYSLLDIGNGESTFSTLLGCSSSDVVDDPDANP